MKFRFFSIFALAGLLLSSCAVDELPTKGGSIVAEMETDQTRTAVTDEGTFTWSAGDKVWLHTTTGSVLGTLSSGAGSSSAKFTYGGFVGEMTGKAVYPYNDGHSISGEVLNFVLPASYNLDSTLTNTNATMYGVNVGGTIKFNHLAGVMRFKFKDVPAGVNKFTITLDKKINGTFTADLTADYPVIETSATSTASEKTITLNFNALTAKSDICVYVPLPIGTYDSLKLGLYDDGQSVWTYSKSVTNTVNRKSLKLMPVVTLGGAVDGDIEGGDSEKLIDYVDEYGENHGPGVKIGETVWAPVNCGYHKTDFKYGKLYQWGRKYGQGYSNSDATYPELVKGPVSLHIGQSKDNENKFYYDSYDWCSPTNDNLWYYGTGDHPIQSGYDPCPEGWRVPSYTELDDLTDNYSSLTTNENGQPGYWFSGSISYTETVRQVFFPAAGHNLYFVPSGNIGTTSISRDYVGAYWSSMVGNSVAYYLNFNKSEVVGMTSHSRANGYSVRCVQEQQVPSEPILPDTVNLSENGTANSYIISSAGSYKLSTVKGNSSTSVGTVSKAEVLWESFGTDVTPNVGDLVKNISYKNGEVTFQTADSFKEGNAVIAAKDASGNILWSWHIWLTDQPEEQVYKNNAGTMMDRNLGATSATPGDVGALGLLYQWGRKDPFLASSSISSSEEAKLTVTWPSAVSTSSSTGTVDYVTSHPTTFVTGVSLSDYDWCYSSRDNSLWTTSDKTKSIYDPCPAGWRVPDGGDNGIWSKALGSSSYYYYTYNDANKGINFSGKFGSASTIWYPASGYHYHLDGSLGDVGNSGYYWSASLRSNRAYILSFNDDGKVSPSNYFDRAFGHSVRCVQE